MLKFNLHEDITEEIELGPFNVSNEVSVRFVIENATGGNIIEVSGRITGQPTWDALATLTGTTNELVTVDTYDVIKVVCSTFASSGNSVRIIACSFNR